MAMGKNVGLGLVKRTSSFGRKRILILNHMDFDSIDVSKPTTKKQFLETNSGFCGQRSLLQALPQEILVSFNSIHFLYHYICLFLNEFFNGSIKRNGIFRYI